MYDTLCKRWKGKGFMMGSNWLEIVLLILGVGAFVASFLLPEKKGKEEMNIDMDAFHALMEKEMKDARAKVSDIVDETVEYAVEKTERASERISNEKIMAINEYSETVLADVNKAHQEVMFLYDMLNDKHKNVKETVKDVDQQVKEVKEQAKEVKEQAKEISEQVKEAKEHAESLEKQMLPKNRSFDEPAIALIPALKDKKAGEKKVEVYSFVNQAPKYERVQPKAATLQPAETEQFKPLMTQVLEAVDVPGEEKVQETNATQAQKMQESVTRKMEEQEKTTQPVQENVEVENNNDKILRLSKLGMSSVDIAKELGLGVGEVKLVINLFKGAV